MNVGAEGSVSSLYDYYMGGSQVMRTTYILMVIEECHRVSWREESVKMLEEGGLFFETMC